MAKNIKAGKVARHRIKNNSTFTTHHNISFSFKYLDDDNAKFSFNGQSTDYFRKIFDRLKSLSTMTVTEFVSNRSGSLKSHCIKWEDTSVPQGFKHLNEQFQAYPPYQFAISRNEHGRVHGFFVDNIFHIVWLDPTHNLYA